MGSPPPPTSRNLATRTRSAEASNPEPDFEASEVSLLLKACRKYRRSLPVYLQSVQEEVALVDGVIQKLESLLGVEE